MGDLVRTLTALPVVPPKPPEGEPCNGCGHCCVAEQCDIGRFFIPADEGEVYGGGSFACGLVVTPGEFGLPDGAPDLVSEALGIGRGCDDDSEAGPWMGAD